MRRGQRPQATPAGMLRATSRADSPALLQVHPVPADSQDILSVAVHLLRHFAVAQGKGAPALSEDAARYLIRRRWALPDLASRISRAVENSDGSLITAADLA